MWPSQFKVKKLSSGEYKYRGVEDDIHYPSEEALAKMSFDAKYILVEGHKPTYALAKIINGNDLDGELSNAKV